MDPKIPPTIIVALNPTTYLEPRDLKSSLCQWKLFVPMDCLWNYVPILCH